MFPRPYHEGTVQPVIAPVHGDFCQLRQCVQMPIVIVALLQVLDHSNDILPQVGKAFDKRLLRLRMVTIHERDFPFSGPASPPTLPAILIGVGKSQSC